MKPYYDLKISKDFDFVTFTPNPEIATSTKFSSTTEPNAIVSDPTSSTIAAHATSFENNEVIDPSGDDIHYDSFFDYVDDFSQAIKPTIPAPTSLSNSTNSTTAFATEHAVEDFPFTASSIGSTEVFNAIKPTTPALTSLSNSTNSTTAFATEHAVEGFPFTTSSIGSTQVFEGEEWTNQRIGLFVGLAVLLLVVLIVLSVVLAKKLLKRRNATGPQIPPIIGQIAPDNTNLE